MPNPASKTLGTKAPAAATASEKTEKEKKKSHYMECKFEAKKKDARIGPLLKTQFNASQLYGAISDRLNARKVYP